MKHPGIKENALIEHNLHSCTKAHEVFTCYIKLWHENYEFRIKKKVEKLS